MSHVDTSERDVYARTKLDLRAAALATIAAGVGSDPLLDAWVPGGG
jgi:hypothetical protein